MKNKIIVLTLNLCLSTLLSSAQTFKIDPGHTAITTKVLRFGLVNVVGRFNDVSGLIIYDPANLAKSSADIVIKTESYTANNADGEKAIKSAGFLDATTYSDIRFALKGLAKKNNQYEAIGTLTLHGISKDIIFPVIINGPGIDPPSGKQSIGISGSLTINRQDYGIAFSRKLPNGTVVVSNEVLIEINVLGVAE